MKAVKRAGWVRRDVPEWRQKGVGGKEGKRHLKRGKKLMSMVLKLDKRWSV